MATTIDHFFSIREDLIFSSRGGISSSLVFWVLGDAFVFNLGDVTGITVDFIGDDLLAAVGENDAVRTGHNLAVAGLGVAEIVVRRLIFNGVSEAVRGWRLRKQ